MIKFLFTAFFAGAAAVCSGADDGRSLVEQQAHAVQSIDNFEVVHQVDITRVTAKVKETKHSYVQTWISRPGHLRAESQRAEQSVTIVSTGAVTWLYNGSDRTYWQQPGSAPAALFANAFPGLARQLSDANLPTIMTSARIVRREELSVARRNFLCDVVEVNVRPGASPEALANNFLRLWISRDYKVPLKVQAQFISSNGSLPIEYLDYATDFQPNLAIAAAIWQFQPPAGASPRPTASAMPHR